MAELDSQRTCDENVEGDSEAVPCEAKFENSDNDKTVEQNEASTENETKQKKPPVCITFMIR